MKIFLRFALLVSALLCSGNRVVNYTVAGGGTPTVTSASITTNTAGESSLNLTYSESVSVGAGGAGGMSAAASGGTVTLGTSSGLPGTSESIPITNRPILSTETGTTRSYTQPGNGREATTGGIDLATYTTQSVTNSSNVVAVDDYVGTGALSGSYTDIVPGITRVSGQASATLINALALTTYTGVTAVANQRLNVTLRTTPTANKQIGLVLRYDFGSSNGYAAKYDGTTLKIDRDDNTVPTTLSGSSVTVSIVSGDKLSFEANGSAFTVYKNGVAVSTGTDATYTAAQAPALIIITAGGASETFAFDDLVIQNLP